MANIIANILFRISLLHIQAESIGEINKLKIGKKYREKLMLTLDFENGDSFNFQHLCISFLFTFFFVCRSTMK